MAVNILYLLSVAWSFFEVISSQSSCGFSSQCEYNINVNHCTAQTTSSRNLHSSSSCPCSTVTQAVRDISAVKNWTDKIQQEFNTIAADLRGSKNQLQIKHGELSSLLGQNQIRNATLQNYLQSIEKANNDIVNERQNWATEKSRLQNELRNVGREAQICKTSFGTLPSTQKPVSNTNIKLSFCGFENPPLCGYTQDGGDSFDWTRGSNTLHSSTGPKQDHTFGNPSGHYLYIDAYNQATHTSSSRTSHARITSPEFPPASGYCIFFWYNMHGSDIKDFKMYAKVGNGLGYPVYEHSGEIDENWHLVKVNLDSEYTANSFRVVFEGNTNAYRHYSHSSYSYYNRNGNIAIDDVYVYNTSCYNIPSTPPGTYNYTNGTQSTSYTFHSTPMSWYDAKIVCKNEGPSSNLISVNSQEEQEFIVNTIKASESLHSTGMYGFYTSGNDKRIEKTFDWTDTGTPYTTAYQNWHTGQPNNVGGNQNCLLLQYPEAWEWGDVNCNDKHPFICEINNT